MHANLYLVEFDRSTIAKVTTADVRSSVRPLDTGVVADTAEIAQRKGIHRATVNDLLRLALLDSDIVMAAFEGTLPRTVTLEKLVRNTFPLDWGKQREMIVGLG